MDDKKKQELNKALENANIIYQDMINIETNKAKEKFVLLESEVSLLISTYVLYRLIYPSLHIYLFLTISKRVILIV